MLFDPSKADGDMLVHRAPGLATSTGLPRQVRTRAFLTPFQAKMMSTQPDMIRAFARMIADDAIRRGEPRTIIVRADVVVTLNGRAPARLLDPQVDLAREQPRILSSPR